MAKKKKNKPQKAENADRRDQDILWRSVRKNSSPLKFGQAAYNFHDFAELNDVSLLSSPQITAKTSANAQPLSISEPYRFATWTLGEAAKLRGKDEKHNQQKKPDLSPDKITDLDRATAEKFRRGKLAIEAKLDLHGLTQDGASRKLKSFLEMCQMRGQRCVVIVTGKGDPRKGGGVLKRQVPNWLNLPENRNRILAISNAQPRDGGGGALYVLLKRRR